METKNVVITPEYLEKIRRYAAIRPDETFVYVPEAYRDLPEEMRPKFTLSPITGEEALRYADSMRGEVLVEGGRAQVNIKHGEYAITVVKRGLKGWDGYYDLNGAIIGYTPGVISNLPRALIEELCEAITSRSRLTDEEVLGLK